MTEGFGVSGTEAEPGLGGAGAVLLVFRIEGREYALPVGEVVEVLRMVAATPLPEAPPWVAGVINFRGQVLPLIDLRSRLGTLRREPELSDAIIVVRADKVVTGLVVDEVVEVLPVQPGAVEPPSGVTSTALGVSGVAREGDRLILMLDEEQLCEGSIDLRLPFGPAG